MDFSALHFSMSLIAMAGRGLGVSAINGWGSALVCCYFAKGTRLAFHRNPFGRMPRKAVPSQTHDDTLVQYVSPKTLPPALVALGRPSICALQPGPACKEWQLRRGDGPNGPQLSTQLDVNSTRGRAIGFWIALVWFRPSRVAARSCWTRARGAKIAARLRPTPSQSHGEGFSAAEIASAVADD
jgi:hypothetical protein